MEKKYKIYILIISVLIVLITIILVSINKRSYYIVLEGENPIFIYEGGTYVEPGYYAFDSQGQNVTGKVKIETDLDNSREGEYKMTYMIEKKAEITRTIIVKEIIPDDLEVAFTLNGNMVQDIKRDSIYNEHGYKAIGSNQKDYSKYVTIEGIVDIHKVGTYQITYNLNVGSVHKKLNRTVNVVGEKYTLTLSDDHLTNKNVIISIKNNSKDFSYFLNPLNGQMNDEKIEFTVTQNGEYTFYLCDALENCEKIDVDVSNIDKFLPTGTCKGIVSGKNKTYTIEAFDENGIAKYRYNGKDYNAATFTVLNDNDNDFVSIYDNAGNEFKVACNYDNINKKGKIVANYDSETLKYWIEKPTSTYVLTHIWVKNGYEQIKTANNEKMGTLETAKTIMNREFANYTKGMVTINASAFVMKLTNPLIKYNDAWKFSTNAPIIIDDGEILRDFTNNSLPSTLYPVYGLKSNGYLGYYNFDGGAEAIAKNKSTLEKIKSDGVKYTFSFNPILVINNEAKVNMTSKNIRQALCQIDRNNFVIVSNINPVNKRLKGLSLGEVADIMVKEDCKFGINLDGGGSLSLYYKKDGSSIKSVKSSNRKIADILYFIEQ